MKKNFIKKIGVLLTAGVLLSGSVVNASSVTSYNETNKTFGVFQFDGNGDGHIDYNDPSDVQIDGGHIIDLIKSLFANDQLLDSKVNSLSDIGMYDSTATYNIGDAVIFNGKSYVCKVNGTTNVEPGSDDSKWEVTSSGIGEWDGTKDYKKGAFVIYNGHIYECTNDYTGSTPAPATIPAANFKSEDGSRITAIEQEIGNNTDTANKSGSIFARIKAIKETIGTKAGATPATTDTGIYKDIADGDKALNDKVSNLTTYVEENVFDMEFTPAVVCTASDCMNKNASGTANPSCATCGGTGYTAQAVLEFTPNNAYAVAQSNTTQVVTVTDISLSDYALLKKCEGVRGNGFTSVAGLNGNAIITINTNIITKGSIGDLIANDITGYSGSGKWL